MKNRRNPERLDIRTCVIKSTFVTEDADGEQRPGILMVGGWGSVQQALTHTFGQAIPTHGLGLRRLDGCVAGGGRSRPPAHDA